MKVENNKMVAVNYTLTVDGEIEMTLSHPIIDRAQWVIGIYNNQMNQKLKMYLTHYLNVSFGFYRRRIPL